MTKSILKKSSFKLVILDFFYFIFFVIINLQFIFFKLIINKILILIFILRNYNFESSLPAYIIVLFLFMVLQ